MNSNKKQGDHKIISTTTNRLRLLWLGLLFLSISWLFFIPIFTPADLEKGVIFLIIGILCSITGIWKTPVAQIAKKYYLMAVSILLFSILVVNTPYNIGLIILAVGVAAQFIISYAGKYEDPSYMGAIPQGLLLSGLILIMQTVLFPFYTIFVSHGHRADFFSPLLSAAANLFGFKTSVNNGIVFVQTFQQIYPLSTTWEKLGLYPWLNIILGATLLILLMEKKRKTLYLLSLLLVGIIYLLVRYIIFIPLYINVVDLQVFYNPFCLFLSFLPFTLLLMKLFPIRDLRINLKCFTNFNINKKHVLSTITTFIFIFSLIGAFLFQDPGVEKRGRILIDEMHSEWENTTRPLDKEWYGVLSTYNYYSWAEWLDHYYSVDINLNSTLNTDLLSRYDILVLKCPTNSYSDEEIKSVIQFVKNGGGLYLIGDHTNVFGINTFLNQISEHFGIRFKTDATYELGTGGLSVYKPDSLLPHPIVQHIKQFSFMTSCTLQVPLTSENIIIGNRLISEPGTYSTENFFRESVSSPDSEYGLFIQAAAVKHGKGRVVAFTDSTCFSSFCIFTDGYQKFNLATMEYLNRINKYSYINNLFILIAAVALPISVYMLKKEKNREMVLFLLLTAGLLSFSIATPIFHNINKTSYPLPEIKTDYINICFEQEHSDFKILLTPSLGFYNQKKCYGTFFVWTQRIGCVPSLEKTLKNALKGDIVVIINPIKNFSHEEIKHITEYVERGGQILLMDSILNKDSTANNLLQNFGLWIKTQSSDHNVTYKTDIISENTTTEEKTSPNNIIPLNNATIGNITIPHLSILGGDQTYKTENNETVVATKKLGKGKIVVMVDSYTFTDYVMGNVFTEPTSYQRKIYNTEFYIFEKLLLKNS
ncbi:MAG: hypothetical protein DRN08_00745 [Thermoplasmata archaeon]|nr:MAG: hypothetical protein DRN05_02835 [Thermoplasmata archaeon]RLF36752.1 MAG: hypothetical protein DRN08_00745 [Thermoplasmata archaeon]